MTTEYVRYRIPTEEAEAFLASYRRAAASLDASPYCRGYDLDRCQEEPERWVLRIRWTSTADHLEGFRKSAEFRAFLGEIRPWIGRIEEMQHYEPSGVASPVSLYEAVGGSGTFFRLARDMHHAMVHDPVLAGMFSRAAATHVPHLGMWLCEVFGGPPLYSDALGDIGSILARHARLDLTEAQRAAFVACARRAVEEVIPPDPPGAREAILAYIEWGSRVAVENSRPDHVPDPAAGVPRWSWDSRG